MINNLGLLQDDKDIKCKKMTQMKKARMINLMKMKMAKPKTQTWTI